MDQDMENCDLLSDLNPETHTPEQRDGRMEVEVIRDPTSQFDQEEELEHLLLDGPIHQPLQLPDLQYLDLDNDEQVANLQPEEQSHSAETEHSD